MELLDPERRRELDQDMAAQVHEQAVAEFNKFLAFALTDGVLTAEEEKSLLRFGAEHGLTSEEMSALVETELEKKSAKRAPQVTPPRPARPPRINGVASDLSTHAKISCACFRLSGLDGDSMTDDQRDAFINMAENLGIDPGEAEDMVDSYLEEADQRADSEIAASAPPPVESDRSPPSQDEEARSADRTEQLLSGRREEPLLKL